MDVTSEWGGSRVTNGEFTVGRHTQFPPLYETFLDAVYGGAEGRQRVIDAIGRALRDRGVTTLLDCAAGTGFPTLDLALDDELGIEVHCSDGDAMMLRELVKQAHRLGQPVMGLRPRGLDHMIVRWADLALADGSYDCVMCRGNSLAYADTWSGGDRVPPRAAITDYLKLMSDRVRSGGWLYVDAPIQLSLGTTSYRDRTVVEEVTEKDGAREWRVQFHPENGSKPIVFTRRSSLLTRGRTAAILRRIGYRQIDHVELDGERENFGVIMARKPEGRE